MRSALPFYIDSKLNNRWGEEQEVIRGYMAFYITTDVHFNKIFLDSYKHNDLLYLGNSLFSRYHLGKLLNYEIHSFSLTTKAGTWFSKFLIFSRFEGSKDLSSCLVDWLDRVNAKCVLMIFQGEVLSVYVWNVWIEKESNFQENIWNRVKLWYYYRLCDCNFIKITLN